MGDDSKIRAVLDADAIRRWARGLVVALEAERDALDRINVYPVADSDTGTNLLHTSRAALAEVERSSSAVVTDVVQAMATGALDGARGNSGMLLSQVLRGVAQGLRSGADPADGAQADGGDLRRALATAAVLARKAMSEPVEGTLLSVLGAAADAVEAVVDPDASVVARAAVTASAAALERTPGQLRPLADAGVVDAGGRGLVILLDLLHAALHGGQRIAETPPDPGRPWTGHGFADLHESRYAYEVMYSLSGVDGVRSVELRAALNGLGDCVAVVDDGAGSWAVHVHCDDIGAAIEAGIETGRVHRINVTRFADQQAASISGENGHSDRAGRSIRTDAPGQVEGRAHGEDSGRAAESAILACVTAEELAELFRAEGAVTVLPDAEAMTEDELGTAIRATRAEHIVVLPNDSTLTGTAERAARVTRDGRRDVVVVPTASPVQGLAALAVHDATRTRSEDTVAMAEAAAATRRGELVVAEHEALTWAGRCQAGDVLGLVDGEVVLIDTDVTQAATTLADRMLVAGGELVTALAGVERQTMLDALSVHLRRTHPEVEVTQAHCGPAGALLLLGVE